MSESFKSYKNIKSVNIEGHVNAIPHISVREFHASLHLELAAHELREDIGANQFFSLLAAAYRVAGSEEANLLEDAFPGISRVMRFRYMAPAGLMPGETWRQDNLIVRMDETGNVTTEEISNE